MKPWLQRCWFGARVCGAGVRAIFLWTLWLALALLLAVQVWIAVSHELAVPQFVLRMLEERLAASNVQVKLSHARFDPTGRILLDHLTIFLPAYTEPIASTTAAFVELDPWKLIAGQIEPHRLHLTGARFAVPAMLSQSGRSEDIVRDLDCTFTISGREVGIDNLTARVAGIAVAARGAVHLTARRNLQQRPLPLADFLANHYPLLCRQVIRIADRLTALRSPELRVELTPSETRGAIADVTLLAQELSLSSPYALQARGIELTTRFPLQGEAAVMAPLQLRVDELDLPDGIAVRGLTARLRGALQPALYTYDPRQMSATIDSARAHGFTLTQLSGRLTGSYPRLKGELVAAYAALPITVKGTVDLARKSGNVSFDGVISPSLLAPIGEAIHRDIRPYLAFGEPVLLQAKAAFGDKWRFDGISGRFRAKDIKAHRVHLDEGGAEFEFDGIRFTARHAFARLGPNFARGTFEQDFSDLRFRFLLEGRLRPLAISGWFGKWWPDFFDDFVFPLAPPEASVDVAGRWKQGLLTSVFVYADSTEPVVRQVKFDHMRTLLFIRPNFIDGLELFTTLGAGAARGTFAREVELGTYALIGLDLDFESTLPLDIPGRVFGPVVAEQLVPFRFTTPPSVRMRGRFDGPASPEGSHQWLRLQGQSTGGFYFNDFPLSDLAFKASIRDDEVNLEDVTVNFAGGTVTGKARVWGREEKRRLGFDLALRDARFSEAVRVTEDFTAKLRGLPPQAPDKFVQERAGVKLSLAVSAEGHYTDPYTYNGSGHATLEGAELGEIHMLGLLSELFSFTSLRFTAARANFEVKGPQIVFSELAATGANSAIDAHGSYDLRQHALDFKARVNPFRESKFLPSIVMGAVLSPFASVLEVKLTGSLDKPSWSFVNGPTNLLRNLTRPDDKPDYLRR